MAANSSLFTLHSSFFFCTFAVMNDDFDIREQQLSSSEKEFENALRPLAFHDFSGQQQVVENLEVFV